MRKSSTKTPRQVHFRRSIRYALMRARISKIRFKEMRPSVSSSRNLHRRLIQMDLGHLAIRITGHEELTMGSQATVLRPPVHPFVLPRLGGCHMCCVFQGHSSTPRYQDFYLYIRQILTVHYHCQRKSRRTRRSCSSQGDLIRLRQKPTWGSRRAFRLRNHLRVEHRMRRSGRLRFRPSGRRCDLTHENLVS